MQHNLVCYPHVVCWYQAGCLHRPQHYGRKLFSSSGNIANLNKHPISDSPHIHLQFPSLNSVKPNCSCINMKPLEVFFSSWTDKERYIFTSHQTVFLLSNLADPSSTLSTSTQCFENVSAALLNYADNIRTPRVCGCVCVFEWIWAELSFRPYRILLCAGLDQKSFLCTWECEAHRRTAQTAVSLREV